MKKELIILCTLLLMLPVVLPAQKKYEATWESVDSRPIPGWFTDAKFGIFIHWGLYSVPAWGPLPADGAGVYDCYAEWYWAKLMDRNSKVNPLFVDFHTKHYGENFKYQDFVNGFTCDMFNPGYWAKLIREAGARYVVLTSKHHEGFALWPSTHAWNWNAMDVGPHRDLAGELTEAVRSEGLHMGFYYSLYEWFNPLYKSDPDRYVVEHMLPQMKDLVNRYRPDVVWTDGEWDYPSATWRSTEFLAWLYNDSPVSETVVVNDRWGKETRSVHGGIYTTEYDLVHDGRMDGRISHPWEECRGIGHSFGYNRNEQLADYSTSEELVHLLIDKVAAGGNLLLNIGPTADGRIPVIMQQRLTDIGRWLECNGEAIYETCAWDAPHEQADAAVRFTRRGNDLYVICTRYPEKPVTVKGLSRRPASATLLGSSAGIRFSQSGGNLTLVPPPRDAATGEYAWVFKLRDALTQ
ncbi:MAG: alpha-L-fucosidase [Tannerella sp.]|jgi:alpha-L-fucosidase|nr:alpha-L-fucosidase [Tannerella sp.]